MNTLHVKTGDTVVVLSGKDKGKQGKIIVEGVAMVKKHQKPRGQGMPGGIVEKEAAIPASKVMVVCPKCGKNTRVGHELRDGKKVRTCKKCGAEL